MMRIIALLSLLFLCSCGANYHLKRAEYHEKLAIAKGAVIKADTVFIDKLVTIPEVKTDTVFKSTEGDTVFISKERLKIKYVKLPGDSVYIEGKCDPDTVKIKVPFTVTKHIKTGLSTWDIVILSIVMALVFFICGYTYRMISKK